MADNYQSEIRVGQPIIPPRKSYSGLFGMLAALLLIAAVAVLLWMNYDSLIEYSRRLSSASPQAMGADEAAELTKELRAFQQQTTDALGSTRQLVESQQAELKGLSGQIADLTAKIEKMQVSAAPAQPVLQPPPPSAPPRPPQAASPARAAVLAPRKRPAPAAPRPEGAISVGGAPLPTAGAPAR